MAFHGAQVELGAQKGPYLSAFGPVGDLRVHVCRYLALIWVWRAVVVVVVVDVT